MAGAAAVSPPRSGEVLAVGGIALAFAAFQVWWWGRYHAGFPWFIDEAGYLDFAVDHAEAWRAGSLSQLRDSLERQSPAAPLVSLATAVGLLATDRPVGAAVGTMAVAGAALVVATWFLARWFLPPRWALAAAGTVGALPTVLTLSATYYFATTTAACFTAGLACLLRSDWGARRGWAVGAGVAFALAALTRTMIIGFFPAVVVVAAIAAIRSTGPGTRGRRLAGLAIGGAVAALLAAPWYVANLREVLDYLGSSPPLRGAGARSTGAAGGAWRVPGMRDVRLLVSDLLLPMTIALLAAFALAAVGRLRTTAGAAAARASGSAGAGPIVAVVVLGAAVLVGSSQAVGQWMPLLPAVVVLTLTAVRRWAPGRPARAVLLAFVGLSVLHVAEATRLVDPVDGVRTVAAGPFGRLPILDNRTLLEEQLVRVLDGPHLDRRYRDVPVLLEAIVVEVADRSDAADEPGVLLVTGGHDAVLNLNGFRLADDLVHGSSRLVVGALPVEEERSTEEWALILADPTLGQPNALVTFTPVGTEPTDALGSLLAAVSALGFEPAVTATLPDERAVTMWWRPRAAMATTVPAVP
jgi:hypothetical protein